MAKNLKKTEEVAKEVIGVIKNLDITDAQKIKKNPSSKTAKELAESRKKARKSIVTESTVQRSLRKKIKDPGFLKLKPVKPKKTKDPVAPIPFSHQPPQVVLKPGTPGYVRRIKADWELEKEKRNKMLQQADIDTLTTAEIADRKKAVAAQREKDALSVHLNTVGAVEYTLEKYYKASNKHIWNSLDQIAKRPLDPLNQTLFKRQRFTSDKHSVWGLNGEDLQNRTPFRFASDSHSINVGNSERTKLTQTQLDVVVMKDTIARMFLKLNKLDPKKGALFHAMYPTWNNSIESLYNNIKYMGISPKRIQRDVNKDKVIKLDKKIKTTNRIKKKLKPIE